MSETVGVVRGRVAWHGQLYQSMITNYKHLQASEQQQRLKHNRKWNSQIAGLTIITAAACLAKDILKKIHLFYLWEIYN